MEFVPKLSYIQELTRENSVNIVKEKGNYFIKDIGEQIMASAKKGNNYVFYPLYSEVFVRYYW